MPFSDYLLPKLIVPHADAKSVIKLKERLGTNDSAVRVRVATEPAERERDCYANVRNRIKRTGTGRMQLGWAIWKWDDLYIEAEPHAILDPGEGEPWIDCTPHDQSPQEILFVPNDKTYDFSTQALEDNIRVPLRDDPRVEKALRLYSEKIALWNTVPGVDIRLPKGVAERAQRLQDEADLLLVQVMAELKGMPSPVRR